VSDKCVIFTLLSVRDARRWTTGRRVPTREVPIVSVVAAYAERYGNDVVIEPDDCHRVMRVEH
jgi:hypothetical protein